VLDGAVPELELGALLFALAKGGESTDDLIGFHRALAARTAKWSPELSRRAVSIPVYGLYEGEAAFAALLAAFLRRFDVPVVLHGPLEPRSSSAASLLRDRRAALRVLPKASGARAHGIAFVSLALSVRAGDLSPFAPAWHAARRPSRGARIRPAAHCAWRCRADGLAGSHPALRPVGG
jgi:hypothetical protein